MPQQNRRLAAILFTDIVGYTAIMQRDEQTAVAVNKRYAAVLKQTVLSHEGEILNDFGDGSLCTFTSATEAVNCAIEMQQQLQKEPKVPLRIGLHIGEIFFEDGKVFGDGVNIASRIQSLGIANSILFSQEINSKLSNKSEFKSISIGKFHFKNVIAPMEVFALANEGLALPGKRKTEGKLKEKKKFRKKILLAAAFLLLAVVSFLIYRQLSGSPGFTGKEKSIAVLPFDNISAEKENEYISDGFTIDIINKLSKLSGLKTVPGWARIKIFKATTKALKDIAVELGVAAILTGTIQIQADKLRITVTLYDVNTGKTIWSTDDNRKWGDVLTIQNEVAEKIATSLSAHLTPEEKKGIKKQYTENTEAYGYYIKGRYFWDNRTTISFDSAEVNYKKAIELDPNYGLAYAGLADLFIFSQSGLTQLEAIPVAREYANKALLLDSTLGEAMATLGFIQSAFDYDWKKAKLTLEKAIRLNPAYTYAHIFYGNLLQYTGEDTEKGIEEIKKARELDPLSVSVNWILGRNYYFAGKLDSAESQLRKTISINAKYNLTRAYLAYVLLAKERYAEAIEMIRQVAPNGVAKNFEYQGTLLSYAYAVSGNPARARAELNKALKENSFTEHYLIAKAATGLKDYNLALTELEKAVAEKEIYVYFLNVDPVFNPLKNETGFKELLRKAGFE